MTKFDVNYFYLATGMEGRADTQSHGIFEADSKAEAVEKAIEKDYSHESESLKSWTRSCLIATEVK